MPAKTSPLAIRGGPKAVTLDPKDLFRWPIVTREDEEAVLGVLRRGAMSGNDVTIQFEHAFARWLGRPYTLGYCNGTASILGALWACGVGVGDEVICPTTTYWASALPTLGLGATVVFADIEPRTLCLDPRDLEHRITRRTKAIVVVHLYGHPADMDPILRIARRHKVRVLEDCSHAHGGLYKGRRIGTLGDVACFSLMSGKPIATGEAGMLATNDRRLWERAVAFGFYERTGQNRWAGAAKPCITDPELIPFAGLPLGGFKHRMNQTCSAMGLVQLKHYPKRMAEIQKAINYFWDGVETVPGLRGHRPPKGSRSTMGGWYIPMGFYDPEQFGGLPVGKFAEAVKAEGCPCVGGIGNGPLHLHPVFQRADIYGHGKPTVIANARRDVRQGPGSLPVAESRAATTFFAPYFRHYRPRVLNQYIAAVRKVAAHYRELLP
jgi:dTDP-4-amino-4,6-dideoxygalactose transaminase